jgi:hypothetical protein
MMEFEKLPACLSSSQFAKEDKVSPALSGYVNSARETEMFVSHEETQSKCSTSPRWQRR